MDNVYFVGTKELASFLITTPQGHILMNSNYESSVPLIRGSVEKLGQPEVKDLQSSVRGKLKVAGLEVTMQNASSVSCS